MLEIGKVLLKYNLGQNIVDTFTKSSNMGFSMKMYRADFSEFGSTTVNNLSFGWPTEYLLINSKHLRDFLEILSLKLVGNL